jgi:hypothetical protein
MTPTTTAADHMQQAAAELQRCPETGNWPSTWRSPSQKRMHRPALEQEVQITWLLPEPEARQLPWLRERFWGKRPKRPDLIAYSTDARGRCIRCWLSRPEDRHAYAELLRKGCGTAPIEAVHPPTIAVGQPALPAHPFLLPRMWQAIAASEGTPVELPAANMQSTPQKLAEIESAFWEGMRPPRL